MGIFSGTEIVNDGLVFAYDMSNTQKSWKGQPATNLLTYSEDFSNSAWNGNLFGNWINSTVTTNNITAPDGTLTADTLTGNYGKFTSSITATTSTTYTFSCWLKNVSLVNPVLLHIAFGLNGTLVSYNNITTVAIASISDWSRFSVTVTSPASGINQIQCGVEFGNSKTSGGTFAVAVWGAQVETGSYATPYIPSLTSSSSRSTTQALLDLTNNIIPTASSLTYVSNNTFSFNGSTDYITLPSSGIFESSVNYFRASAGYAWSISAWFKFPVSPVNAKTVNASYAICGHAGGIGGGETLTLFVGSGTDATYGSYTPYKCAVGIFGAKTILSDSVNTNTWNNIVITWDGSAGRGYFNGVDVGALNIGTAALQTGYSFTVGMVGGVGGALNAVQCFEGSISNFLVYNRGLLAVEVLQNFNAIKNRYIGESSAIPAESGYVLKQMRADLPSGYYWIKNSKMPNALRMYVDMSEEGGGYDFYPMQGTGASIGFVNGTHSGIALGLDLVFPRSKDHWIAMSNFVRNVLGSTGNEYFTTTYAVHRETSAGGGSRGGNYTGDIMRNPISYGTGAPDWRVPDGGRWWLRDTTFSEPNGDYTAYNFLGGYTFPNPYTGQDIQFNDVTGQNYTTGAYYLLSTNGKP